MIIDTEPSITFTQASSENSELRQMVLGVFLVTHLNKLLFLGVVAT